MYIGCKLIKFCTKKLRLKQYRVPFESALFCDSQPVLSNSLCLYTFSGLGISNRSIGIILSAFSFPSSLTPSDFPNVVFLWSIAPSLFSDERASFSIGIWLSSFLFAKGTLNFLFACYFCVVCFCSSFSFFRSILFLSRYFYSDRFFQFREEREWQIVLRNQISDWVKGAFINDSSTVFNVSFSVRNNSFLAVKNLFQISMYSMAVAPLFRNKNNFDSNGNTCQ